MSKETIEFGKGSFIGKISRGQGFFSLPVREQAKIIGWANSCPVTDELTDPDNPNLGRGPEAMRERYAEVNFWFGFILDEAQRLSPGLHQQLIKTVDRQLDEPAGKYEPENVPSWHEEKISPMGRLSGYALPRIFIEQLGTHKGANRQEIRARMMRGLDVLEDAINRASNPIDLLALVGEGLIKADCSPKDVLKHSLSQGWMAEHNSPSAIQNYKEVLQDKSPELWQAYTLMTQQEKDALKLV